MLAMTGVSAIVGLLLLVFLITEEEMQFGCADPNQEDDYLNGPSLAECHMEFSHASSFVRTRELIRRNTLRFSMMDSSNLPYLLKSNTTLFIPREMKHPSMVSFHQ